MQPYPTLPDFRQKLLDAAIDKDVQPGNLVLHADYYKAESGMFKVVRVYFDVDSLLYDGYKVRNHRGEIVKSSAGKKPKIQHGKKVNDIQFVHRDDSQIIANCEADIKNVLAEKEFLLEALKRPV